MNGERKRKALRDMWSPSDTAFTTQRMILQRYYQENVAVDLAGLADAVDLADAVGLADADACVICLEPLVQKMTLYLPCKHVFHYACCQPLIAGRSYKCPLCRGNFSAALAGTGISVADGPHADGPHAEGPHADGSHADGPHAEGPHAETVLLIHMDLYDLLMEVVWQNYQHNAALLLQEEDLLEDAEADLFDADYY